MRQWLLSHASLTFKSQTLYVCIPTCLAAYIPLMKFNTLPVCPIVYLKILKYNRNEYFFIADDNGNDNDDDVKVADDDSVATPYHYILGVANKITIPHL